MSKYPTIKELQNYLEKNGFYSYLDFEKVTDNYSEEINFANDCENKRSIILQKNWESITDFGISRDVLIMELGASYLKLYDTKVISPTKAVVHHDQKVSFYEDKEYTLEILFHNIQKQMDAFVPDNKKSKINDTVLVFANALDQFVREDGQYDGIGVALGKMHQFEKIAGEPIGDALQKYLRRNGYPNITISVINDTLAGLLSAKAFEILNNIKFDSAINMIVGTGTNLGIRTLEEENQQTCIVNAEFGSFKGAEMSRFDLLMEKNYNLTPDYHNEKMISGSWQHLMMETIIKDLVECKMLDPEAIDVLDLENLDSAEMERITENSTLPHEFQSILQFIWREIIRRGSTLCGLALSVIVDQIYQGLNKEMVDIAIIEIGGVLENATGFRENLLKTLNNELIDLDIREKVHLHFFRPRFPTVFGALILNSTISKQK